MEGIRRQSAFTRLAAASLRDEHFVLVDVGCSGGIAEGWRQFGDRLKAVGFDCSGAEIAKLATSETSPTVHYIEATVGLPTDHPVLHRKQARAVVHHWPQGRLSCQRAAQNRAALAAGSPLLSIEDYFKTVGYGSPEPDDGFDNDYAWRAAYAASGAHADALYLPHYLPANGIRPDFIKIDVDGPDFEILRTLDAQLSAPDLLGVMCEVNFVGSHDANDHTFHNTDRLLRSHGFDLFNLTLRRYSSAALPWPFQDDEPTTSVGGRPVQGDALYLRDLGSPVRAQTAASVSDEKLVKLSALFSLFSLPDEAAELLLTQAHRLVPFLDIAAARELLAREVQEDNGTDLGYHDYMAAVEAEAPVVMNQNGRRNTWLAGLQAAQHELTVARARIEELERQLSLTITHTA